MPKKNYVIGTRGSLLALTQCGQIKDQLEKLTGDHFELKVIKTEGDLKTDKPLWQLDGKDFFTKELDAALLLGEVDLVVHSYKDLGSERPEGIGLAAITKRNYAQDILLIKNETIENLKNKKDFLVGTSSPRRIVNIEKSLGEYLPTKKPLNISTKMLRGNVNTRIQKLRDNHYDAIVLALPGIERLALTHSSKIELEALLKDLNYMILPQGEFPSAASQGALGVEYNLDRKDNDELLKKLQQLNHEDTISEIKRERQAFNSYGGGCHLAVGINVFKQKNYHLHIHKGVSQNKDVFDSKLEGVFPTFDNQKERIFIGLPKSKLNHIKNSNISILEDSYIIKKSDDNITDFNIAKDKHLYVTSNYCIPNALKLNSYQGLFSSGIKSMKALANEGLWVNATSDSRGDQYLKTILESKALQIIHGKDNIKTLVLTNDQAKSELGDTVCAYKRSFSKDLNLEEYKSNLEDIDVFYWTSFYQYTEFTKLLPSIKTKFHCSGLGKTLDLFTQNNITVRPFCNITDFIAWAKK